MSKFAVLVDSDAFVGWQLANDPHHEHVAAMLDRLRQEHQRLVTTSLVINETATVISHKDSQSIACEFLATIERIKFPVIHITKELQHRALKIFQQQTRRGTSLTDCANVAVMRDFGIPRILSFDKVYSKDFGLETVQQAA